MALSETVLKTGRKTMCTTLTMDSSVRNQSCHIAGILTWGIVSVHHVEKRALLKKSGLPHELNSQLGYMPMQKHLHGKRCTLLTIAETRESKNQGLHIN